MEELTLNVTLGERLYGGIYAAPCRFANIERFVGAISGEISLNSECDSEEFRVRLLDLADRLRPQSRIADQETALRKLVADDLRAVATTNLPQSDVSVRERIGASADLIIARLKDVGLNLGKSSLYVVEEFPPPFNQFGWAAFAPDREDEERYGVKSGVYFRRDGLRPLYSEALFAHEMIHTVPGRVDPEIYAMGLEEGIAEVLGTCFGALETVPLGALRNILIHGRHGVDRPKLWSLYRDHTRQAFLLYQEFGIDGLVELANSGRSEIHKAETAIFAGTFRELALPRGGWDENTWALLSFFCNGYLPSHVFSPLEVILIDQVDEGRPLSKICQKAGVPEDVGIPLLGKLGSESALFVQDGNRIGYSNVQHYLSMGKSINEPVIRYLPPITSIRQE